jgi:hypothetical protein
VPSRLIVGAETAAWGPFSGQYNNRCTPGGYFSYPTATLDFGSSMTMMKIASVEPVFE